MGHLTSDYLWVLDPLDGACVWFYSYGCLMTSVWSWNVVLLILSVILFIISMVTSVTRPNNSMLYLTS